MYKHIKFAFLTGVGNSVRWIALLRATAKPLEQIRAKRYFEKYSGVIQKIFLIGVEFSKAQKNIVGFEWEEIN